MVPNDTPLLKVVAAVRYGADDATREKMLRDELISMGWTPPDQAAPVAVPDECGGKEQDAFEDWAHLAGFDLSMHPLHYKFINDRTSAARYGWTAAIRYCRESMLNAAPPAPAESPVQSDDGLPGMWSHSDMSGGETDMPAPAVDEQELKAQGIEEACRWMDWNVSYGMDSTRRFRDYAASLRAQQQGGRDE